MKYVILWKLFAVISNTVSIRSYASPVVDVDYSLSAHSKDKIIGSMDLLLRKNADGYVLEARTSTLANWIPSKAQVLVNTQSSDQLVKTPPRYDISNIKIITNDSFELTKFDLLTRRKNKVKLSKVGDYYEVKSTYHTTNLADVASQASRIQVKEKSVEFKLLAGKKYIPKMMLPFYIQANFNSLKDASATDIPVVVEGSLEFKSVRIVYLGSRVVRNKKQERFELLAPLRVIYTFDESLRLMSIDDMRRKRRYESPMVSL